LRGQWEWCHLRLSTVCLLLWIAPGLCTRTWVQPLMYAIDAKCSVGEVWNCVRVKQVVGVFLIGPLITMLIITLHETFHSQKFESFVIYVIYGCPCHNYVLLMSIVYP
jgi:uncharacterized membrane protein YqhA